MSEDNLWFLLALIAVSVTSSWLQRRFGWVIWGSVMAALAAVWLLWKVAPL